jgi:hypothetical protein
MYNIKTHMIYSTFESLQYESGFCKFCPELHVTATVSFI